MGWGGAACPPRGTLLLGGAGVSPSDQPLGENPARSHPAQVWWEEFAPA